MPSSTSFSLLRIGCCWKYKNSFHLLKNGYMIYNKHLIKKTFDWCNNELSRVNLKYREAVILTGASTLIRTPSVLWFVEFSFDAKLF